MVHPAKRHAGEDDLPTRARFVMIATNTSANNVLAPKLLAQAASATNTWMVLFVKATAQRENMQIQKPIGVVRALRIA